MTKHFLAGLLTLATATSADAMAVVYAGTGTVADAQGAFNQWSAAVGARNFTTDGTDGGTGTGGSGGSYTTALGNVFSISSGSAGNEIYRFTTGNFRVLSGSYLGVIKRDTDATLTWSIAAPAVNSFGFNFFDTDGGTVRIDFVSGTYKTFSINSANINGESNFWGISGLSNPVSSVSITFTDPDGVSSWDNFSYGNTAAIPVPAALPMMLTVLGGLGYGAWRRKRTA